MPGTLFVVATPIGNLEDLTPRALRVLRQVRLIAAEDTRRTANLLRRYTIETPVTSLHQYNESTKVGTVLGRLRRGEDVAIVSDAGTPTISDPGQYLVRCAIDSGFRVEPIPGASAILTALAGSGFHVDAFTFLGFPPIRSKDRATWLELLRSAGHPVVFFEAPHRIKATLRQILGLIGDCRVSVGRELTKVHEEFVRGPISEVLRKLEHPIGEYTVVADIGLITKHGPTRSAINAQAIAAEFFQMTKTAHLSRRRAVTELARSHGLTTNAVYKALEDVKKSGE
jgi:16S rRNA (cytidine1402-2'-O)-methyltransferase